MSVTTIGSLRYMAVPHEPALGSDQKAVDGLGVGLRKTGSGAVPQVLPVLIKEQDRAKQPGKLRFHHQHQLRQCFLQRSIAGDHFQNAALSVAQRLCSLALGDVHHCSDEFKVSRLIIG